MLMPPEHINSAKYALVVTILCGIVSAIAQLNVHAFKEQVIVAQLGKASR
jgi:hypothetical protein